MDTAGTSSQLITHYLPSKAYNGYTLFCPISGGGVWLVDMQGQFINHWKTAHPPGNDGVLLPNGNLLYAGMHPDGQLEFGGRGGELLELDWDGNVIWKYEDPYMHHDFHRLPNGNTMTLRWVPIPDDITARVKGGVPGTEREGVMWADSFREITPEGKVVWEWLSYEHLDPETDAICSLCHRAEWTHANTCFVLPDGDVLISFLTLNTIAIIDKGTGDIKWRWGPGELAHPHDPNMLDNGNILVFDNGSHRPHMRIAPHAMVSFSRVLEVDPRSQQIVWEYMDESRLHFFSSFIAGCQRLPNGNTLICEGGTGRFFEVTMDKEVVWEFVSPFYFPGHPHIGRNNAVFRAHRYGPDYPGLKGKPLDPGRVELTLREKPSEKKAVEERLRRLGY